MLIIALLLFSVARLDLVDRTIQGWQFIPDPDDTTGAQKTNGVTDDPQFPGSHTYTSMCLIPGGNVAVLFGGNTPTESYDDATWTFTVSSGDWTLITPSRPSGRILPGWVGLESSPVGDVCVMFGGRTGGFANDVHFFTDSWQVEGAITYDDDPVGPVGIQGPCTWPSQQNDTFYVWGGYASGGQIGDPFCTGVIDAAYETEFTCNTTTNPPAARDMQSCWYDYSDPGTEILYVYGGRPADNGESSRLHRLTVATLMWDLMWDDASYNYTGPTFSPGPRNRGSGFQMTNGIGGIFGGENDGGPYYGSIYVWDTDHWDFYQFNADDILMSFAIDFEKIPGGKTQVQTFFYNRHLFVFGGLNPGVRYGDTWKAEMLDPAGYHCGVDGQRLAPTAIPENLEMDMTFAAGAFGAEILSHVYCGTEFQIECWWIDEAEAEKAQAIAYSFGNFTNDYWTDELVVAGGPRRRIQATALTVDDLQRNNLGVDGGESIGMKLKIREMNTRWFNGEPYVDSVYSETEYSKTVTFWKWVEADQLVTIEQRHGRILVHGQRLKKESEEFEVLFYVFKRTDSTLEELTVVSSTLEGTYGLPTVEEDTEGGACPFTYCHKKKLVFNISSRCDIPLEEVVVHFKLLGATESIEEDVTFTIYLEEICAIEECPPGSPDDPNCVYESTATLLAYRSNNYQDNPVGANPVENGDKIYFEMVVTTVAGKILEELHLRDVYSEAPSTPHTWLTVGSDGADHGDWSFGTDVKDVTGMSTDSGALQFYMNLNEGVTTGTADLTVKVRAVVVYKDEVSGRRRREVVEIEASPTMKYAQAETMFAVVPSGVVGMVAISVLCFLGVAFFWF